MVVTLRRARLAAALFLSAAASAQSVTWAPDVPVITLPVDETKVITATICLPGQVSKADIYILADTTTSMTPVLDSVKANAVVLVDALVNSPGVDLRVGVGNYRDFPFDAKPFDNQVSPTKDAGALVAAINSWQAGGGGDGSEAQLYALYQIATDPAIGFRPDAKRIIVWFGDSPGHDPICDVFVGGGVPKDFIQITATSVATQRGNGQASPHVAAIQITTDNTVFGGLGGAGVHTECISWGKEAAEGRNVMVFTDLTIALPLLCQGLAETYGSGHVRPARAAIAADLRRALAVSAPASPRP